MPFVLYYTNKYSMDSLYKMGSNLFSKLPAIWENISSVKGGILWIATLKMKAYFLQMNGQKFQKFLTRRLILRRWVMGKNNY